MENVFLKPARDGDGRPMIVPDEQTHAPLAADGAWKPLTSYWARRIRDRDVTQAEPEKPQARPESAEIAHEAKFEPTAAIPAKK